MRSVALTRKHARVLAAVAAAEAADRQPSVADVAAGVPLRPDLVEVVVTDLCGRDLLACRGEFAVSEDQHLPGPELRTTPAGRQALSSFGVPAG